MTAATAALWPFAVAAAATLGAAAGFWSRGELYGTTYRREYLMCRDALMEINPEHPVLRELGWRNTP